jgi:hypothetical protein
MKRLILMVLMASTTLLFAANQTAPSDKEIEKHIKYYQKNSSEYEKKLKSEACRETDIASAKCIAVMAIANSPFDDPMDKIEEHKKVGEYLEYYKQNIDEARQKAFDSYECSRNPYSVKCVAAEAAVLAPSKPIEEMDELERTFEYYKKHHSEAEDVIHSEECISETKGLTSLKCIAARAANNPIESLEEHKKIGEYLKYYDENIGVAFNIFTSGKCNDIERSYTAKCIAIKIILATER